MSFDLNFKRYGNKAILIEWTEDINAHILEDIINFKHKILGNKIFMVQEVINCYNSITVVYPFEIENFSKAVEALKTVYLDRKFNEIAKPKVWQIPVCYDEDFGFDLKAFSDAKNLSIKEIIDLHIQPLYKVYFIGFLPGFLYLGGLNNKLSMDRKASPSLKVPKGSVAIGGNQTGIYPIESAGGWHIIGKTPISFFDMSKNYPCFATTGDYIQFISISKDEFKTIENNIKNELYQLNSIVND